MNCKRCNGTGQEPNNKDIGRSLKEARLEAGIGLREMAVRIRISHSYLSQLEKGDRRWSQRLISAYQKQLNKHI